MRLAALIVVFVALASSVAGSSAELERVYKLDASSTRVGLARVHLHVDQLWLRDNRIQGNYEIRVPLVPMKSDRGRIELQDADRIDSVLAYGGSVSGTAHSSEDGRTHAVVCEFFPGGAVRIHIDTGSRVLSFRTRVRDANS